VGSPNKSCCLEKKDDELPSRNKTDSEFILISTMWAKDKQPEIQMVKRISTSTSSNNWLHWWGEKFASWNKKIYYKILPLHHDCNPKDQENSHKLKIRTASSKNRKMNFRLEIKRTVNSSWFWLCEQQINNLKSKWSREWGQGQVPTTAFIDGERYLVPWIKK